MINFEPIIIEFTENVEPGNQVCQLNFTSNQNSYVEYSNNFEIVFEVNEFEVLLGDVNQDETIDILDVIMSINFILETVTPTAYENIASDLNEDGDINIQDVIIMINLILEQN